MTRGQKGEGARVPQADNNPAGASWAPAKDVPSTTERPGSQDVWGPQG